MASSMCPIRCSSGEWRELVPNRRSLSRGDPGRPARSPTVKTPPPQGKFNAAQRFAYTGVVMMGAGSLDDGARDLQAGATRVADGAARRLRGGPTGALPATIGYLLFFVVHISQVIRAGWNNFRAMVTGFEVVGGGSNFSRDTPNWPCGNRNRTSKVGLQTDMSPQTDISHRVNNRECDSSTTGQPGGRGREANSPHHATLLRARARWLRRQAWRGGVGYERAADDGRHSVAVAADAGVESAACEAYFRRTRLSPTFPATLPACREPTVTSVLTLDSIRRIGRFASKTRSAGSR